MKTPKVSVLLPTYNGAKFIAVSIESVLSQSFRDFELMVIDDGSTDTTAEIVKKFSDKDERVVFISNESNLGIQKTLNRGLQIAKGEYIARIDDDDQWSETGKLESQVKFLDADSDYMLVGTGVIVVDENRKELFRFLEPGSDEDIRNRILFKSCFMHSAVLFRKDAVLKLGGYSEDESVRHVEDYELWLRLGRVGKLHNLPLYGIKFMQREGAITSKYKPEQFRKDARLVKSFRADYPNYEMAIFFVYIRRMLFAFDKILPFPSLRNWFIKRYKSA